MNIEHKRQFIGLACDLSPENISCDGELSRSDIQKRYRAINAEWKKLEKVVDHQVTEDDAWGFCKVVDADDKKQAKARNSAAPKGWDNENENVWKHESGLGYIQNWSNTTFHPGKEPFLVYQSFDWWYEDTVSAKLSALRDEDGRFKEKVGETETLEEAIEMFRDFMNILTEDDIRQGLHSWQDESNVKLALAFRKEKTSD